jgi:hypothetical protein
MENSIIRTVDNDISLPEFAMINWLETLNETSGNGSWSGIAYVTGKNPNPKMTSIIIWVTLCCFKQKTTLKSHRKMKR